MWNFWGALSGRKTSVLSEQLRHKTVGGSKETAMAVAKTDLERRMFHALRRIARQYRSAESLLKHGDCGLEGAEALEMAYENIQSEARTALKGIRLAALNHAKKPLHWLSVQETADKLYELALSGELNAGEQHGGKTKGHST